MKESSSSPTAEEVRCRSADAMSFDACIDPVIHARVATQTQLISKLKVYSRDLTSAGWPVIVEKEGLNLILQVFDNIGYSIFPDGSTVDENGMHTVVYSRREYHLGAAPEGSEFNGVLKITERAPTEDEFHMIITDHEGFEGKISGEALVGESLRDGEYYVTSDAGRQGGRTYDGGPPRGVTGKMLHTRILVKVEESLMIAVQELEAIVPEQNKRLRTTMAMCFR